ncbi:MAG: branched-chain amino acid ABC transporter substrate-binding protein [Bacillota bacterium]
MFNLKTHWLLLLVAVLFAFAAFGCGEEAADPVDGDPDEEPADEPEAEFEGEVLIGIMVPTTGSEAADGTDMENAALLAVEEINENGGVMGHRIVTTTGDDGCDPSMATSAASQLVSEEVVAVVGGYCSGATLPTLAIYGEAGIPFVIAASNATSLIDENPGWAFMINSTGLDQAATAVEKFEELGVETIGVMDSGDAYSADLKEHTIKQWEEAGHEVVAEDTVQRGEVDFSAFVTTTMSTEPDAIYWTGYQAEGALLIRQLREGGYEGVIMVGDGSSAQELIDLAGDEAEGVLCSGPPLTDFLPAAQDFIQRYDESFPREPGAYAALTYDATMLLADAMERAGSFDSAEIRDALEATDGFEGLAGPISFTDQNTLARSNFVILEAKDGRWSLVE